MVHAKHCSAEKRHLVIKLKQEGKTFIHETLAYLPIIIRNAFKWKNLGETRDQKRKTREHEDRLIKLFALADPFVTSRHFKEDLNLSVSLRA